MIQLLEPLTTSEPKPSMFQRLSGGIAKVRNFAQSPPPPPEAPHPEETECRMFVDFKKLKKTCQPGIDVKDAAEKKVTDTQKRESVYKKKIRECDIKINKSYQVLERNQQRNVSPEVCSDIMKSIRGEKEIKKDFEGILGNFKEQGILEKARQDALVAGNSLTKIVEQESAEVLENVTDACFLAYISVIETALNYRDSMDDFCNRHGITMVKGRKIKLRAKLDSYFQNHRSQKDYLRGILENY